MSRVIAPIPQFPCVLVTMLELNTSISSYAITASDFATSARFTLPAKSTMNPDFSTEMPGIAPEEAAKMIEAKRRLLERFRRDEKGEFQPRTLETTPAQRAAKRLPDGQHLTKSFPILDLGTRPDLPLDSYTLRVWGEVENPVELTWDELQKLPRHRQVTDFHCVTTWSKYDVPWGGVRFLDIAALVRPTMKAKYVIEHGGEG